MKLLEQFRTRNKKVMDYDWRFNIHKLHKNPIKQCVMLNLYTLFFIKNE